MAKWADSSATRPLCQPEMPGETESALLAYLRQTPSGNSCWTTIISQPMNTIPILCRLILQVKDPASLADWYVATFGWRIGVDERSEGWIEVDAGGGFMLAFRGGARSKANHWPKIQLRVPDVAFAKAELAKKGVILGEIQSWKTQQWAEGSDPEGNTFQISIH